MGIIEMGTIENGEFVGTRKNRQSGGSCRRCHVIGFILNASDESVDLLKSVLTLSQLSNYIKC